ncbi:MAG: hypothetical protein ACE5RJ_00960, partial [Nitrosopumilaceae archaeon]
MKILKAFPLVLVFLGLSLLPSVEAETIKQTMEAGMEIQISFPNTAVLDRTFSVSVFVENNGWEDKQDVIFAFNPDDAIIALGKTEIVIEKISTGGSYGETIDFQISSDASLGDHFLNLDYSQVLLANNEKPQDPTSTSIALPIIVKEQPKVTIHTITPESIFTNAEFPITVEITSEDTNLNDVSLKITPPKDIEFRGETLHTFSSIQKGIPVSVTSRIITPSQEINTEYKIPFQIIVSYTDDVDEEKLDSKTFSLIMRPRTFMELTTDGGIWVGDFFIAPYVSLGTIIGIPAG